MKETAPSFMVYVHESGESRRGCGWSLHSILPDRGRAVRRAQALFSTGRYIRVEIKQRRFENQGSVKPLRIFEQGAPRMTPVIRISVALLAGLALIAALFLF